MNSFRTLAILAVTSLIAAPVFASGDITKGQKDFRKCKACHSIKNGDQVIVKGGRVGPDLYGVIGRKAGSFPGYRYSKSLVALGESGFVWDETTVAEWVADTKGFLKAHGQSPKTKMRFRLRKGGADVAAYLASVGPAVTTPAAATTPASN